MKYFQAATESCLQLNYQMKMIIMVFDGASLARKATGNHLIKVISLEKLKALPRVSALHEIEYATQS